MNSDVGIIIDMTVLTTAIDRSDRTNTGSAYRRRSAGAAFRSYGYLCFFHVSTEGLLIALLFDVVDACESHLALTAAIDILGDSAARDIHGCTTTDEA